MKKKLNEQELLQLSKEELVQIILKLFCEVDKLKEEIQLLKDELARSKKARLSQR